MNIKIFNYDLPADLDLSDEKEVALDNEALGLVLGRDPLTLVQIGLKSKNFFLIKLNIFNKVVFFLLAKSSYLIIKILLFICFQEL